MLLVWINIPDESNSSNQLIIMIFAKHPVVLLAAIIISCTNESVKSFVPSRETLTNTEYGPSDSLKSIHVFVALCDNKSQGIVPVPSKIGNGQDPNNNLYWGAAAGVKTFFKRSTEWTLIETIKKPSEIVLERAVFKHKKENVYLIADAYDGAAIKQCTADFFSAGAGKEKKVVNVGQQQIGTNGNAQLIAYVGHDGLMDFSLESYSLRQDTLKRDAIMLACISKSYFKKGVQLAGMNPVIWSTGLMSPEAYTLKAAIDGWIIGETNAQIRERAAAAYNQYQHCGMKGARNLLVSGY